MRYRAREGETGGFALSVALGHHLCSACSARVCVCCFLFSREGGWYELPRLERSRRAVIRRKTCTPTPQSCRVEGKESCTIPHLPGANDPRLYKVLCDRSNPIPLMDESSRKQLCEEAEDFLWERNIGGKINVVPFFSFSPVILPPDPLSVYCNILILLLCLH